MLPISGILVPVDFSDQSSMAMLPYAKAAAAKYDAELILLHVEKDEELAKAALDQLQGIKVRRVLYDGDPAEVIVGFAKTKDIDLIAMSTHGYGEFKRFLIGSVTSKVLHDVVCPVLTGVHMEEQPVAKDAKISNVLCAIDLGPHSPEVLKWASQLAADFRAQLDIVHVVLPLGPGGDLPFSGEWRAEILNRARKDVETLLSAIGPTSATVYIQEGEPAKAICSYAKGVATDLVVIGRGPQDRMGGRLTTNAYAIIRESPCPVVSI